MIDFSFSSTYTSDIPKYYLFDNIIKGENSNELSFSLQDIKLKTVLKYIQKMFKEYTLVFTDYDSELKPVKYLYRKDNSIVRLFYHYQDNLAVISCWNIPDNLIIKLNKFRIKYKKKEIYKGKIYVLTQTSFGLSEVQLFNKFEQLERGNYTDYQLKAFDHISSDIMSNTPCGRLVILNGPPGSGKSFFVKGLIAQTEAMFLLVPSSLINGLDGPGFMTYFIGLREKAGNLPIVLIVEDADECLLPRDGMNMSSVSTLLNLGDGLLGAALDVRVVCTTNAKSMEIDRALARPGRLCAQVNIDTHSPEVCADIYKRLTGEFLEFDQPTTLSDIYHLANENKLEKEEGKKTKHKFGFI